MTDEVELTSETYRLTAADYAAAWQDRSVLQLWRCWRRGAWCWT